MEEVKNVERAQPAEAMQDSGEEKRTLKLSENTSLGNDNLELPVDGLPKWLQEVVEDYASVHDCPRDFVVAAVLCAVSVAVGSRVVVSDGKHENMLVLWMVLVARSGSNKTAPVTDIFKPLKRLQDELSQESEMEYTRWKSENAGSKDCEFQLKNMQLLSQDMTEESRVQVLERNPHGVLVNCPELKGFFDSFGRYNKNGADSSLLSIFDGEQMIKNRVKYTRPVIVDHPFMSIFGGIQPGVIRQTFGCMEYMHNGMNQRFLWVYPDPRPHSEPSDRVLLEVTRRTWDECLTGLFRADCEGRCVMTLSPGAKSAYDKYKKRTNEIIDGYDDDCCYEPAIYSKLQIILQRFAGIVQMTHCWGRCKPPQQIYGGRLELSEEVMSYSIRCMDYFENTALKVYEKLQAGLNEKTVCTNNDVIAECYSRFHVKSQSKLADALGLHQSAISRALSSSRK